jgi:hypothetical protein
MPCEVPGAYDGSPSPVGREKAGMREFKICGSVFSKDGQS